MVTFNTSFKSFHGWVREFLAECIGTFLLVFIGNNAVAESILTGGVGGNNITIYIGYGLGLFLGALVSANISGGHLNPAVSVAGAVVKKFKWSKVPHYLLGQYLGAFIAACATYLVYIDSFEAHHRIHGINQTSASVFATYPKEDLSVIGSIIDQILGTMILQIAIFAVTDPLNKVPGHLAPIYVSLTLLGIGCSLGINQGFAVNPARDFSPRLFTFISLWGSDVFDLNSYWYTTILGPHIGAILGAVIYLYAVEKFRYIKDISEVATIEKNNGKSNICFTKCVCIDVGAALKNKELQKTARLNRKKLLTENPQKAREIYAKRNTKKEESFSHL